ncbi:MAG TPA: lactate racemase domain-containing protein, partial [Acidimicrobiales bacterium]|nr:lactate racemase domain-containing protein [Acidimicrobiales bacterium]
ENEVAGERALVLVPDSTRKVDLARLFPLLLQALRKARSVEVMVALGTHPPMQTGAVRDMLGLDEEGFPGQLAGISDHDWRGVALSELGWVDQERVKQIAGTTWHPSLGGDFLVRINRKALEVDRVIILGPTLPHEVAGFSGGGKYLFPGISGPEMIDVMHWLGALSGVLATIGVERTPVRALIEEATSLLPTAVSLVAVVTDEEGRTAGVHAGSIAEAWPASVAQASQLHMKWLVQPARRVISCPMPIYGELWTAGKAMYKLEPAVADGGELVIYAPHLSEVSVTHGKDIFRVGYHPIEYFLRQWDRFADEHLAVLAHSSHVKGAGSYDTATAQEYPRIRVTLATAITEEQCRQLNLGHADPGSIDLEREEATGSLVVRNAGEVLYRVATGQDRL